MTNVRVNVKGCEYNKNFLKCKKNVMKKILVEEDFWS